MTTGRSLELYFVDGDPEGLLTAEVFGWTGHVIKVPRLRLKAGLELPEASHTGVYLLLGGEEGTPRAYIGEGENVAKRIREHDGAKEWWQMAVLITTSSDALHKAHVKYLESRMVEDAKKAGVTRLDNGNTPPRSSLNRAAVANMEGFLDILFMVLPALGVSIFQSGRTIETQAPAEAENHQVFKLSTPKNGVEGYAYLDGSRFILTKGSVARKEWASKGEHDFGYKERHKKLVETGVLVCNETHAVFAEDYAFTSPSAAAAVMNGRPANGRIEWYIEKDNRTFGDWEQEEMAER